MTFPIVHNGMDVFLVFWCVVQGKHYISNDGIRILHEWPAVGTLTAWLAIPKLCMELSVL